MSFRKPPYTYKPSCKRVVTVSKAVLLETLPEWFCSCYVRIGQYIYLSPVVFSLCNGWKQNIIWQLQRSR